MSTLNPHHAGSQQHLNIYLNLNAGSVELLCGNLPVISEHPGAWTAAIHHCYSGHVRRAGSLDSNPYQSFLK